MNKTSWIVAAAAAAMALIAGFGAGWFGNQAYLRAQLNSAFEDFNAEMGDAAPDVPEDMEAMEEYEEDPDVTVSDNLPDPVAMGEATSDGIWDITVTGVERADQVNGSYSNAVASDGWEFVILDVELANASNGPQTPEIDGSEIMDADGNRYAYHSDAAFALDDDAYPVRGGTGHRGGHGAAVGHMGFPACRRVRGRRGMTGRNALHC
ncbi:uncharacterized protein DUF4352 [Nocardiopsis sp. Huas11]|uniref:hypothetical protein n=1 Tax=Nocardiopsis sp. Huas11 TaxID=2183912 RepID=UPI000F19C19C|nr:hypothetical protein [Nocardiopsis sp. Huas11]RKS05944.1 uncharacterized protein DUF4352 [Nocardiopsis sp. Huas11]